MAEEPTDFGDLYRYNTANGVVIPQTDSVKGDVENALRQIFGGDFSTDETTPAGVLVSAIVRFFVDVCGVNAQNANGLNIVSSVGAFLDALAGIAGISRLSGESDDAFRRRIVASASRGSGFAKSIANAIGNVQGVTGVVVLDNGLATPNILPKDAQGMPTSHSIAVDAHSVFICVSGGDQTDIANAVKATKSAGCGFTDGTLGGITPTSVELSDEETGSSLTVKFYRPKTRNVFVNVEVFGSAYTGSDIVSDTKEAILGLIADNSMNATVTKGEIISAIASFGRNIVCDTVEIGINDSSATPPAEFDEDEIVVMPYQYAHCDEESIAVTVK